MNIERKIAVPLNLLSQMSGDLKAAHEALDKLIQQHHSATPVARSEDQQIEDLEQRLKKVLGSGSNADAESQDYPDPEPATRETIALPPGPVVQTRSGFKFGSASLQRLATVHPLLQDVARRAIGITTQDFTVFEGVRTAERQQELRRRGVTRTLNSKHLRQSDGWSHAYDLVPWINGRAEWDWEGCYRIACAIDHAATEQGVAHRIRWGGAWDRTLADFGGVPALYMAEVQAYRKRRGGRAFLDGVHFELV